MVVAGEPAFLLFIIEISYFRGVVAADDSSVVVDHPVQVVCSCGFLAGFDSHFLLEGDLLVNFLEVHVFRREYEPFEVEYQDLW